MPFATLILLTAIQSLDREQIEAARMDGAQGLRLFWHITLPHLLRPIAVVVMIETIFLLSVFAEILVTTSGGPGTATTNLTYLIYSARSSSGTSAAPRPAASSPSSSPTSSRSS